MPDIHDYGVLHKDIRPEDILIEYHRDGFKVTFVNFAFSKEFQTRRNLKRNGYPEDDAWSPSYLSKMVSKFAYSL